MKLRTFFLTFILALFIYNTSAQVKVSPIASIEQHTINSKILKQNVGLNIYLPETYDNDCPLHTYPLIVLLEDEFFYQITGVVKHLSSVSSMPEAIVVSFPNDFEKFYAPKVYTNNSEFWPKSWKQMPFDGNPDVFSKFLKDELFSYLSKQYRTADYRMIVGTSATSTFPLHTFSKMPDLFQAHVAIASGDILGMGYKPEETFIDAIIDRLNTNKNRRAHLYVTSADEDVTYDAKIATNIKALQNKTSSYTSDKIKIKAEVIANESHYGVVLSGFIKAMEVFFPKNKWNKEFSDFEKQSGNTISNIDTYYKRLSSEYGYPILPKAERWNSGSSLQASANRLLRQKRYDESIEVYKRLVTYRPKSAQALSTLASALIANNKFKEALKVQEKAIKLAKEYDREHLKYYEDHKKEITLKMEAVQN